LSPRRDAELPHRASSGGATSLRIPDCVDSNRPPGAGWRQAVTGRPTQDPAPLATHRRVAAARGFRVRAAPMRAWQRGAGKVRHPNRPGTGRALRPPRGSRAHVPTNSSRREPLDVVIRGRGSGRSQRRRAFDQLDRDRNREQISLVLRGISSKTPNAADCVSRLELYAETALQYRSNWRLVGDRDLALP
jgi:hypothetical protein